jgi:phosphomannomutase
MVTASHLPGDRNGLKFFTLKGGFSKDEVQTLIGLAKQHAQVWYDIGIVPPTSGPNAVFYSEWVDWMPHYDSQLKHALMKQVHGDNEKHELSQTLKGLKIVLNAGNGSGGFFKQTLEDLGADVKDSIHTEPDGNFPAGVPNPENPAMIQETTRACEAANADLGILLDTDADRCGMVVPRTIGADGSFADYEPLNRNRLIALMGVIFARESPGCAIVTDSVTSNGLAKFLQDDLGLVHVRYLKGYANVISKARSLTESNTVNAEVAIETSGHCALKENDYLDDGTYTAVKVIGLLARERTQDPTKSLLDLIVDLDEMDEVTEMRMSILDGSMESMHRVFDYMALKSEASCETNSCWSIDNDNLEGIRISTGEDGGFFMLRKSLHDPVLCLQIEASSKEAAKDEVLAPLLKIFRSEKEIYSVLDFAALEAY